MIITCPNCNKQFKIDNSLIPDEGRDVQCGSCNHIWFYNIQEKNNEVLELKQEIISEDIEIKAENKEDKIEEKQRAEEIIKTEINNKKKEINSEKQKNTTILKKTENKGSKFFSYLIVFIISFVALIILLDTLKTPLINVFPRLEIILFNLFETLQDIKLFIIDLT
ncbi:zinc-ribbon domain-containing protein [Candidatus Pelagibacter communis]|uniref:zinc-ribbon domain-containing protein n=1 Tax=Pelagibacter ubique TaxID=198252 RepID=UPI00094C797D|nr:zinc-ribbon domain-containing protein [Candidatus Pelagibacter ubique]